MNILNFSTFVFDLDGVIIDSEYTHFECYAKAFKSNINYDLDWNTYCRIHHSPNNSFKSVFPDFDKIYSDKNKMYKTEIQNIELKKGFHEFFNILIQNGKTICIVSDTTMEIFNMICQKYPFFKKCNYVITRDLVEKRKPDSECYLKLLSKIKDNTKLHEIVVFEDSYKGWISASRVIYNCILVNTPNYVYYENICAQNAIDNFKNIIDYQFNMRFDYLPFYISSKTHHREKWINLQKQFPIVANWIYINKDKNNITNQEKIELCTKIQNDINESEFGIVYLEDGEKEHIGSLIEIGLLLSKMKKIYICGDNIFKNEVIFNFKDNFIFSYVGNYNLIKVFNDIQYDMNDEYKQFEMEVVKQISQPENSFQTPDTIDYIVICASGKGTRLLPITKHIPKLLVNVDNLNILNKIVSYWKEYSKKFIIIIDSQYNKIVDFYLKMAKIEYEIINVDCIHGEENSYTIHNALANPKLINKKVLITWCDIYPETIIPFEAFDNTNIIFTYKNYGRYDAIDNTIIKKSFGNIIGIYYFGSFKNIQTFHPSQDICDCYKENFGNFKTFEIENLTDIGDYQKLCNHFNNSTNKYRTRYFNELVDDCQNNVIQKRSTCSYGDNIIANEMLFYKYHTLDNVPEMIEFGENFFKMRKIPNAQNLIDAFNTYDIKKQKKTIVQLLTEIEKIHNVERKIVCKTVLLSDIKNEFYNKVVHRVENIGEILSYFNFIKSVNHVYIKYDHTHIIKEIYAKIEEYFMEKECEYNTIHGDPHMSNVLVDNNNKIWFIDPRGYFGYTKLYGLKIYDISKIIYSLSGFDQINNNDNHFFIIDDKNNINVNINNNIDNFLDLFNAYDKRILIYMTILHWFGLTDYSKNNLHKCISSYYYGIYLYHLYCKTN